MDDLAEKLGCSKKTLYVYYENRADLVSKVITQDMDDHYADIQSIIDQNLNPIDEFFSLNQVDLKKIKTTIQRAGDTYGLLAAASMLRHHYYHYYLIDMLLPCSYA